MGWNDVKISLFYVGLKLREEFCAIYIGMRFGAFQFILKSRIKIFRWLLK